MSDHVLFEVRNGVAVITFNRPQSKNTFTREMIESLGAAYQRCDADDAIRAVVVTGSGDSFCAGADLSSNAFGEPGVEQAALNSCPLSFQAWDVRKPVIAACNGHAIGVGLGIAIQTDLRIFAEQGKYGFLQNRRGLVADFACEYVLPRLVGVERAFELVVRAPRLGGAEAAQWGLASRVLPAEEVLGAALEIAEDMATNCSPLVMGLHKRLLWRSGDMPLADFVALETEALRHSAAGPDAVEGGAAWLERRPPVWRSSVSRDWPAWMK